MNTMQRAMQESLRAQSSTSISDSDIDAEEAALLAADLAFMQSAQARENARLDRAMDIQIRAQSYSVSRDPAKSGFNSPFRSVPL